MKWADYCISKLSLAESGFIDTVLLYKDLGESLEIDEFERNRNWLVQQVNSGKTFCSIKRNEKGLWNKLGDFNYDGNIFSWFTVPKNITRRKTFVSYYHYDDQHYRQKFENLFDDLIINKCVEAGDIDSNNCDEYIKQLIQKEYLSDTTVLIVLVGAKTKCRMHVDWEISGALNQKVGNSYTGLIGILLPGHPDFGSDKYHPSNLPQRLAANVKSGYAMLRDWTDDRVKMQQWIEEVFEKRKETEKIVNKFLIQMKENTCE